MREITIVIKPTLEDIGDPSNIADFMAELGSRIDENIDLCLEAVGEAILKKAKANAERGYTGLPYGGGTAPASYERRSEATRILYELSPYHTITEGLDTGRKKLIDSLDRGGHDNIFNTMSKSIEVGTSFKHAHLLEHGGDRGHREHIGFTSTGAMKGWLKKAVIDGRISPSEVRALWEELSSSQTLPSRPFLRPALWYMRDEEEHTKVCGNIMVREVIRDMELDINVRRDGGIIDE